MNPKEGPLLFPPASGTRRSGGPLASPVSTDAPFTFPAFAKINWILRVLNRRADNFHEIRTVFQTISLHDQLTFSPLAENEIQFVCDSPHVPANETNLVYRAARLLKDLKAIRRGAHLELKKNIPTGGGLGGGSSDAAVTMLGLAHLWQIETSESELASVGAQLGADVPFFFTGGTALGEGRGEKVSPLRDVTWKHLLVVAPGVEVSTAKAYEALGRGALTKTNLQTMLLVSRAELLFSDSLPDALHNDFEPVIFRQWPEIKRAARVLYARGARKCLLAGSGASVFGLFDNQDEMIRASHKLKGETGWRVFECATLTRAEYRQALRAPAQFLR